MKKLLVLLLVTAFCFTFCSCSKNDDVDTSDDVDEVISTEDNTTVDSKEEFITTSEDETNTAPEEIDGYQYAEFEKYNSYAEDNGLRDTLVYIQGEVKSVHEHENACMLTVASDDSGKWVVALLGVEYSDEIKELLDRNFVVCFGNYRGYSEVFQMPAIYADKVHNGLKIYTIEDLMKYSNFIPKEPNTEKTTTIATEPVTEQKEQNKELIYNDNGFEVYYTGKEIAEDGDSRFNLEIHNNSGLDMELTTMYVSVNDYVVDPIFRVNVPNGKIANKDIYFMDSTLEKNNISQIDELEFTLLFYDPNSSIIDENRVTFTSDSIIINP